MKQKNKLNNLTGKEWIKSTKSWFIVNPKRRSKDSVNHPGKFPEELVEKYINFFTKKNAYVLDPFLGVGSTLIACENTQRNGIGIELSKEFADIARSELKKIKPKKNQKVIVGDSSNIDKIFKRKNINIPKKVDFIITSPPYWNMLGESRGNVKSTHKKREEKGLKTTYSENTKDLGNVVDYDEFLDGLADIFEKCYELLKDKKYMVVVLQNLRNKKGRITTLAWDLAKKLDSEKFIFAGEQLWLQDNKQLGIWGYPNIFVSNVHHHYCLVFYKNTEKK